MAGTRLTHCKRKHPFTRENTYYWTDGKGIVHRKCAACAIRRQKNYRDSLKGTTQ